MKEKQNGDNGVTRPEVKPVYKNNFLIRRPRKAVKRLMLRGFLRGF